MAVVMVWDGAPVASAIAAEQAHKVKTTSPVTVLKRLKLGNYIEDLDFISNGPFAHHLVAIAGSEVYGMPATTNSDRAMRKLFDFRRMAFVTPPKGFAYMPTERLFAFIDTS